MRLSVAQYKDIKDKIEKGMSDRQIARSVGRRRQLVAKIRRGEFKNEDLQSFPDWVNEICWEDVLKEIAGHFEIKFIWNERASKLTSYCNFTKYLYKKFPYLKQKSYTHRHFEPGERVEVDWAGDKVEWFDQVEKRRKFGYIFVSCLGSSQLIFAKAFESMKQQDFLMAHEGMFVFYGGVTKVVVPDNTKTAVLKSDKYDPDLNPLYDEYTKHYGCVVAPARSYRPKDKALVEGAVKLVWRLYRWRSRNMNYLSLLEINQQLEKVIEEINNKKHSRFKISRRELFELNEKSTLMPLPTSSFSLWEQKMARVHPDGMVVYQNQFYSVPYQLVGSEVLLKIFPNIIEIYKGLEKVGAHEKLKGRRGQRSIVESHCAENSQVYRSTTAQYLIQQSKFISADLHQLIDELLKENASGNLRRAQGLIGEAKTLSRKYERLEFTEAIKKTVTEMRLFNNFRVERFKQLMRSSLEELGKLSDENEIKRIAGNPMIRQTQLH